MQTESSNTLTIPAQESRKEALELFISIIQAVPESFQKNLTGEQFAEQAIKGAEKILKYLVTSKPI